MEDLHLERLSEAVRLAAENVAAGGGPFGCVIYRGDGRIAATANTVTATLDPTAHAEVNAIREACTRLGTWDLSGCVVYASSEPCPMCLAAIYWARAEAVYFANPKETAARFGFDDAFIYRQIALPPQERSLMFAQFRVDGQERPFELWKHNPDKTAY